MVSLSLTQQSKSTYATTQYVIDFGNSLSNSAVTIVPDLHDAASNLPMSTLKLRLEDAKPLGLARVHSSELLVIYDGLSHSPS
jgi:hypothetical protein